MNPAVFIITLWLIAGLDWGLREPLAMAERVVPQLLVIFMVFLCVNAPAKLVPFIGVVVGITIDLLAQHTTSDGGSAPILGPGALGGFLAAHLVLALRGLMFSKNVVSLALLAGLAAALLNITQAFGLTVRSWYDPAFSDLSGTDLLVRGLGSALYTALVSLVAGLPLFWAQPLFGFESDRHTGFRMR